MAKQHGTVPCCRIAMLSATAGMTAPGARVGRMQRSGARGAEPGLRNTIATGKVESGLAAEFCPLQETSNSAAM